MMAEIHMRDIRKIPYPLHALPWQLGHPNFLFDGETYLFAVPVCDRDGDPGGKWHYELSVVDVFVDDGSMGSPTVSYRVDGNPWGWEPSDADFYVQLRTRPSVAGARKCI